MQNHKTTSHVIDIILENECSSCKEIYYKAKFILESILNHSQDYKYNLMGLILCKLEVPYRRNHYYFCSEFVSEILAYSQAIELPKLPCLMKPSDYLLFEELECLYQGNIGELIKYRGLC